MRPRALAAALALAVMAAACSGDPASVSTTPADTPVASTSPEIPATTTTQAAATTRPAGPRQYGAPPAQTIDATAAYSATIETSLGDITVELFAADAPVTVNNFVFLARDGYYDGVIFHRVVPGFVIQGGDPTGTGRGGPGYTFADELDAPRPYDRGILAMANAGPDTNGSQFFIVLADSGLPYQYNIFGQVTEGLEVVDAIASVSLQGERPVEDVTIETISIQGP